MKHKALRILTATVLAAALTASSGAGENRIAASVQEENGNFEAYLAEHGTAVRGGENTARISENILDMLPGEKKKLKILGKAKNVKWTSDDLTVAKINKKGKVTAVGPGIATIRGQVKGKSYYCTVAVSSRLETGGVDEGFRKMAADIKENGEYSPEDGVYRLSSKFDPDTVDGWTVVYFEYTDFGGGALDKLCIREYAVFDNGGYEDWRINWLPGDCIAKVQIDEIFNLSNGKYINKGEGRLDRPSYKKGEDIRVYYKEHVLDEITGSMSATTFSLMFTMCKPFLRQAGVSWSELGFTSYE